MKINIKRLKKNLKELEQIGLNQADGGIYRTGFSEADMKARKWFLQKAEQAGLKSHMDNIGNVFATYDRAVSQKSFLVGSHLDSVPCGGNLDGALGVLAGLECAQTLLENQIVLRDNLEIIGTSEEEGRFGGMIGTETLLGEMTENRIKDSKDADNITLETAIKEAGLNPDNALQAARDISTMSGFLELHIEQGPVLEKKGIDIGIVEGISGIIHWKITLQGECNHSGTTPMSMRKDAFQGAVEFCNQTENILQRHGTSEARASVGKIEIIPPNPHTIAGNVEFNLIIRDFEKQKLEDLSDAFREHLDYVCMKKGFEDACKDSQFHTTCPLP